jgi:hypothetical protein
VGCFLEAEPLDFITHLGFKVGTTDRTGRRLEQPFPNATAVIIILFARTIEGVRTATNGKVFQTNHTIPKHIVVVLLFSQHMFNEELVDAFTEIMGGIPHFLDGIPDMHQIVIKVNCQQKEYGQSRPHHPFPLVKVE